MRKKFHFVVGDVSHGPVSAAASVEADTVVEAQSLLTDYITSAELTGAPDGVIELINNEGLQVHVRVPQEAIEDTGNWDSDDIEVEDLPKAETVDEDGIKSAARKKYIESPDHCPFCGAVDIEGDSIEVEDTSAFQDMRCLDCAAGWQDEYTLARVRKLSGPVTTPPEGLVRCSGCGDSVERHDTCRECGSCNACCGCYT